MQSLSQRQARRIALAAQGFRDPRHTTPTMRTFNRTLARTGVLQVDSVNVLQRAHYMPLFSRMGPYDPGLLTRASEKRPRRLVEYWAHVQALMPVELWPVMQHRMDHYRAQRGKWNTMVERPELEAVGAGRGPRARGQHRPGPRRRAAPRQGAVGLELVGHPQGARLPLHVRRPRDRRAQLPVRGALRPARAGAAGRGARRADPDRSRRHRWSWSAGRRSPTASPPRSACGTTTGCTTTG